MEQAHKEKTPGGEVEFVKGCPLCEDSDPELGKTFEQFAHWLYAVMTSDRRKRDGDRARGGVDIHS